MLAQSLVVGQGDDADVGLQNIDGTCQPPHDEVTARQRRRYLVLRKQLHPAAPKPLGQDERGSFVY